MADDGFAGLAGCSSTPRVVETQPNLNAVSPEIRALIEATPEFQLIARLAAQEGKRVEWARASQAMGADGRTVVQIPLWWSEQGVELLVVAVERGRVADFLFSRVSKSDDIQIAVANLISKTTLTASITYEQGQPKMTNQLMAPMKGVSNLNELFEVSVSDAMSISHQTVITQQNCQSLLLQLAAAASALTVQTGKMMLTCFFAWWTPACWYEMGLYVAALLAYYAAVEAAKPCL